MVRWSQAESCGDPSTPLPVPQGCHGEHQKMSLSSPGPPFPHEIGMGVQGMGAGLGGPCRCEALRPPLARVLGRLPGISLFIWKQR